VVAAPLTTVTATVPALHFTNKIRSFLDLDTGKSLEVELYRTAAAGTVFNLCAFTAQTNFNTATIAVADTLTDATIAGYKLLYTTGGVLEHIPPPAPSFIAPFKDRIFSCDGNLRAYFSKSHVAGEPINFNDALYVEVDSYGGVITGMAQLDDKFILFKRNAIYYTTGDGPNNTGGGANFQAPIFVTAEIGCTYHASIVNTPDGLMFNGARGYCLLKPTLEVEYIGKEIEYFGNTTIYGATVVSEQNETRFISNDGVGVVYNYLYNNWSINTNETANGWQGKGSCLWQNKYTRITNDGGVYQENTGFLDGANNIFTKVTTGWISLSSLAGFQRVYRAIILGRFMSAHNLKITVYYDYLPNPIATVTITPASLLNISAYSDAVLYADATFSSGTDAYEFSYHLPRQKCQAIAFSFEDLSLSGTQEGFQLTGLTLEIGVKDTAGRFNQAASIG
jgi:hypothetical protein